MTTLSGTDGPHYLNYYNPQTIYVDLATAGFAAGSTWTFTVQATSSACSDQIGFDVYLMRPDPSTEHCFHWSEITPSGANLTPFTYGPSHVGDGIEWSGTAGATGCADFTRLAIRYFPYFYPGTCAVAISWSVTYTGTGGSVALCAYGTEPKPGVAGVVIASMGLVGAIGAATLDPAVLALSVGILGTAIVTHQLCGVDKPIDQVIDVADWSVPGPSGIGSLAQHKLALNIRNAFWDFLCQCTPAPAGLPAPVAPPPTIVQKPADVTYYTNVFIDNTEISTTINELWQYFLSLTIGSNNNIQISQVTANCACIDFKLGPAHEGLTGEGAITVSGIHGLSVIFTTLPDRIGVASGDPDTIYGVGWINVGNDWGWQARMYPNTTSWIVFPPDMHQMNRVGYSFPFDVVATIAELVSA